MQRVKVFSSYSQDPQKASDNVTNNANFWLGTCKKEIESYDIEVQTKICTSLTSCYHKGKNDIFLESHTRTLVTVIVKYEASKVL